MCRKSLYDRICFFFHTYCIFCILFHFLCFFIFFFSNFSCCFYLYVAFLMQLCFVCESYWPKKIFYSACWYTKKTNKNILYRKSIEVTQESFVVILHRWWLKNCSWSTSKNFLYFEKSVYNIKILVFMLLRHITLWKKKYIQIYWCKLMI